MSRSTWLAGARALLRLIRGGRGASAASQKSEHPRAPSTQNWAAPAPLRSTTFDVEQEIRAILGDAAVAAQRVRLEIAVQPELVLHADRAGFHRSLAGLVQHACSQALVSRILVTASRSGEWIEVAVSDDAIDADLGSRQHALWHIERLIAQQGGSLEVASWSDQGITVLTRWHQAGPVANGPGPVSSAMRERAPTG